MALQVFPNISKQVRLKDRTQYAYVHIPAAGSKPTFLLLHGFPSFSYDWRHQITALSSKGFGVLAPDLLGYGDTDSPAEVEAYKLKRLSDHTAEILAKEGLGKIIGVAHDRGTGLLSRLYTWYPDLLLATVFLSVGYTEPTTTAIDIDAINAQTKQIFGYSLVGYWKVFNSDDAATILDNNPESIISLAYPADPLTWKTDLGPVGAAEAWFKNKKTGPRPVWLTQEDERIHHVVFGKNGYNGPLNWYKVPIRNIDAPDHARLSEERKFVNLPTLLIVSTQDYIARPDVQKQRTAAWVKDLKVEELDCGHWIQLEQPERVNQLLEDFAAGLEKS